MINVIRFVSKHRTPLRQAELDLVEARRLVASLMHASTHMLGEMAQDAVNHEFDIAMDQLFEAERRVKRLRTEAMAA